MERRDSVLGMVPIAGLGLLVLWPILGGRSTPPSSSPSPAPPRGTASPAGAPTAARGAICNSWSLSAEECGNAKQLAEARSRRPVEFVVATLPDPVDSRYAYNFDRYGDALQRAAEGADYLLDRFVLPWQQTSGPAGPNGPHRSEPGLLLFRSRDGGRLLALPLVGELPTTGVHRAALAQALDLAEDLGPGDGPLRLLGPSFTGSQVSLAEGIRWWRRQRAGRAERRVEILSGAATAVNPRGFGDGVVFSATAIPDRPAMMALLAHLRCELGRTPRVALLAEANTAYGRQELFAREKTPGATGQAFHREELSSSLRLAFPLHISQLRSAYAREKPAGGSGPSSPLPPIALEESGEPVDSLPALSRLEVNTAEAVLSHILETLDRERFDYVGLLASDVRDRLFLARHIRRHCPSTKLFVFGADLLYLNPGENTYLNGMLVVTPYPLFTPNQLWTYPFEGDSQRWQAPSSTAQGVYNALLLHLGRPRALLEYGYPFDQPANDEARRPALWLSVVGHDALWPIVTLRHGEARASEPEEASCPEERQYRESGYLAVARSERISGLPPRDRADRRRPAPRGSAIIVAAVGVSGGLLALAYVLLVLPSTSERPRGESRLRQLLPVLADPVNKAHRFDGRVHALVALASLTAPGVVFASVFLTLHRWSAWTGRPTWLLGAPVVGALALGLASVATAGAALAAARSWWKAQPGGRTRLGDVTAAMLTFGGAAGVLALSAWTAASWLGAPPPADPEALFRALRSLDLASGLSPLVPIGLLALVGFLWGLSMLARLHLLECLPEGRFLDFGEASFRGIGEHEDRMRDALVFGFHAVPAWPVLVPVAVVVGVATWYELAPSLEGRAFDVLFRASFFALTLAVLVTFLRFLWLWQELRQLLRRLAWHTMVEAYRRLPDSPSWSPLLGWTGRHPGFSDLDYAIERLQLTLAALRKEGAAPAEGVDLETLCRDATKSFREALEDEGAGRTRKAREGRRSVQATLSGAGRLVVTLLEHRWPGGGREQKEGRSAFVARGEEFVASRAAAFVHLAVAHVRNLAGFVIAALVLMLMAAISYPFQPRQLVLGFHWAAILTAVVVTVTAFAGMNRDRVLSYLSGTEPGTVSWNRDWIVGLVTYAVVPVLGLLAAQFPEVGAGFLNALSQALRALGPGSPVAPN